MVDKTYPCDFGSCPYEGLSCSDACGLGRDDGDELPPEAFEDEFDEEFYEVDDPELIGWEPEPLDYNNDHDFETDNPWEWFL